MTTPRRCGPRPDSTGPRVPGFHLVAAPRGDLLLSVEDGVLTRLDRARATAARGALHARDSERLQLFARVWGAAGDSSVVTTPTVPASVRPRALSLAVAHRCNLGCGYCYAQQGTYGRASRAMSLEVARASIDRLLQDAPASERLTVAFIGGEPLANRVVLHAATRYAAEAARARGVELGFAITTNATLIRDEDLELFQAHNFAVTVSLDGTRRSNDRLRPLLRGGSSYDAAVEGIRRMTSRASRAFSVSARVTVTPLNLELLETLRSLVRLGVDSVRFSPLLHAPSGALELAEEHFLRVLDGLVECGEFVYDQLVEGRVVHLENVFETLRRIHEYRRDAYPCGAGGGYLSVDASGDLFACHRFVSDEVGRLGSVISGVDGDAQRRWLSTRHLARQRPCGDCWARYLCSGGCHHEALYRGRVACDYIRGWVHYCLGLYDRLGREGIRDALFRTTLPVAAAERHA